MWKPVVGYEGIYEVSDTGEVRSLDRMVPHPNGDLTAKGRVLRQLKHNHGYRQVGLCKSGVRKIHLVHELVLEAFVGPRPVGNVVRHMDNNKCHNAVGNLQWGTQGDNLLDRVSHGTSTRGERHWNVKLTDAKVSDIRSRKGSTSAADLAQEYDVHFNTIYRIWNNKRWKGTQIDAPS